MELEAVAAALKELGHPTRLRIYRQLIRAGTKGLSVGKLQEKLAIPGSTLNHHISALLSVGIVRQNREGRTIYCVAQYEIVGKILAFMTEECCADQNCSE